MYIGSLKEGVRVEFYHAGTDITFEPELFGDELVWRWDSVFDSAIDIKYSFDKECFFGAVEYKIEGVQKTEVMVDGRLVTDKSSESLIPINTFGRDLVIRVRGQLLDIIFYGAEIFGYYKGDSAPLFLPRPENVRVGDERVKIGGFVGLGEDEAFAKEFLEDSLKERLCSLPDGDGIPLAFELCPAYESERYTIEINKDSASVKAASRLALLWGACRVIDMWNDNSLPEITIDDKPDVPMRGFHMGLPRKDRTDFVKKLFRYVLLPLGYNHVILEFNGAMRFDRHPEISEKWIESERLYREGKRPRVTHSNMGADGTLLEKEDVRDIIDVLESYGIEVVPEVQSLGHVQYLTNAFPEISEHAQADSGDQDARSVDVVNVDPSAHCYCPSREDTMRYIYDIIDEIVEVAKPKRYVHIGHDEVYHLGLCPLCSQKGSARSYVDHVKALHSYLANKGLKVMMWSDMLHTSMYYTGDAFANVISEIPKDILLLDFTWYFEVDRDIEDDIIGEGHQIMMGNLYSSHYPRYSARIAKPEMIGGEISTWVTVAENDFAENGKFFDFVYTAEMLWNAYSYDDRNRVTYNSLIGNRVLPMMRDLMHGKYGTYHAAKKKSVFLGTFPGSCTNVPDAISSLGLTEPTAPLTVNAKYDRFVFKHATLNPAPRIAWKPLCNIGSYTVVYEDGERVHIPVDYAGGILYWNTRYADPMPHQYYRHQGYLGTWFADPVYESHTSEGKKVLLLGQVWDNPRPEKVIKEILYTSSEGDYARLVSAGVIGIKK